MLIALYNLDIFARDEHLKLVFHTSVVYSELGEIIHHLKQQQQDHTETYLWSSAH